MDPSGSTKLVILHMDMAIHTFDDIMRVTENLNEKYIIGYGASSTVYKCTSKTSRPIAIKRIYNQYPSNFREFETELETIGSIRHRNIVSLHGYALSPFGNLLFYDYMENGSLWDLLHGLLFFFSWTSYVFFSQFSTFGRLKRSDCMMQGLGRR